MALFWALVGKSSTILKYYCHKLWKFALLLTTALILSVKNGYSINWYLRSKYHVQFEVNTHHDRSRWHFGAGPRLCYCAKRAWTLLSIYQYHLMDKTCNIFGVATSPIVSDLSTSFNGMNLNMWSCTSSSLFLAQCSLDFRSTKRALFEVLSTKSST